MVRYNEKANKDKIKISKNNLEIKKITFELGKINHEIEETLILLHKESDIKKNIILKEKIIPLEKEKLALETNLAQLLHDINFRKKEL